LARPRASRVLVVALLATATVLSASVAAQPADAGSQIRPLVTRPDGEDEGTFWARITDDGRTAFLFIATSCFPIFRQVTATGCSPWTLPRRPCAS
jgi:hypothetical protein